MFTSIVVGTDGSATADEAVRRATDLAKKFGARLHVVSATRSAMQSMVSAEASMVFAEAAPRWDDAARDSLEAIVEDAAQKARKQGVETETYPRFGDAADVLCDVAESVNADLIVVGNRGMTGAKRFLLGSVPNKVSHHSPCSVLIVHTASGD